MIYHIDEVCNKLDEASCQITQDVYDQLQDCELFTEKAPVSLKYREFIIGLSLWNQYGEEFKYRMTIKKEGSRFQREVREEADL